MLLKSDHSGDVTLALSSYARSVISAQQNLKKEVSYSWEEGVSYYAAEFGLTAYLTCSFLNNPDFTYHGVNLSGTKQKLSAIRYAEDGDAVWGGLFWDIRSLLTNGVSFLQTMQYI